MKIRFPLFSFLLGIFVSTLFATIGIHSVDQQWKLEAYKHGFAIYTFDAHNQKVSWMWLDDYVMKELARYSPPPTPEPRSL